MSYYAKSSGTMIKDILKAIGKSDSVWSIYETIDKSELDDIVKENIISFLISFSAERTVE